MRVMAFRIPGHEVGSLDNVEETMVEIRSVKVSEVMSTQHKAIDASTPVSKIVEQMASRNAHHVCIVENREPIGIVSRHHLL